MGESEKSSIVLVAAKEDVLNNLRDALADTNLALLHAQTKHEAIALLGRLTSEIDLAINELELPDLGGWDLITELTRPTRKVPRIIATTAIYAEPFVIVRLLGVDAVVPKTLSQEEWLQTVEAVLTKNENTGI